jgi:hypothetical protein
VAKKAEIGLHRGHKKLLEHFRFYCRLPCPIHFRVFCRNGWDTDAIQVYTIFENALNLEISIAALAKSADRKNDGVRPCARANRKAQAAGWNVIFLLRGAGAAEMEEAG